MKRECLLCHGEGSLEHVIAGGRFDPRAEQWYPSEETKTCPLCKGAGSIEKPQHENTFNVSTEYQTLKTQRTKRRSDTNKVVAYILGLPVEDLEPTLEEVA
jgi:DnaJ-class molecular chaperone